MKNTVALFLGIILLNSLKSQENWLFYPSLGSNLTFIDDGGNTGTSLKNGLHAGIGASMLMEEHWSFDYGLNVNMRFATYYSESESDELNDLLNIGTIPIISDFDFTVYNSVNGLTEYWTLDVPLTVSYKFNSGFMLFGGGYLNYLLSARNDEENIQHIPVFEVIDPSELTFIDPALLLFLPTNSVETTTNKSKSEMRDLGFGVNVGLGYRSENFMLRLSYLHGINDLRKDLDLVEMNIKNQRTVQLSIAFLFKDIFMSSKEKPKYDLQLIE